MTPKLTARRDELAKKHERDYQYHGISKPHLTAHIFQEGFNAAYEELLPVIEALSFYAEEWSNPECDKLIKEGGFFPYSIDETIQAKDAGSKARQALAKIGVE